MAKNLQEVGDTYHALLGEPKDVRSILGRSRFNRGTKCKSVKNAEITAAPWIVSAVFSDHGDLFGTRIPNRLFYCNTATIDTQCLAISNHYPVLDKPVNSDICYS